MLSRTALITLLVVAVLSPHASGQSCNWIPLPSGTDGSVYAMAMFDDGTGPALYVGGDFTMAGGTPANNVAKWDGTTGTWSPLGSGADGVVTAMTVLDDGTTGPSLCVGGSFATAGGVPAGNIAAWNGAAWLPFGAGLGFWEVSDLLALRGPYGDTLLVAANAGYGLMMTWRSWGRWDVLGMADGRIASLALISGGVAFGGVHACGGFSTMLSWYSAVPASGVARYGDFLGAGYAIWTAVGTGLFRAEAVALLDGGSGAALYAINDASLEKWDGVSWSPEYSWGSSTNSWHLVDDLTVFDDGTGPELFWIAETGSGTSTSTFWVERWDGTTLSTLGGPVASGPAVAAPKRCLEILDDGTGPTLWVGNGGDGSSVAFGTPARWSCASSIAVAANQPGGPGAPLHVANANLTPGREYFNLVSIDPCSGGPGTGPGPFGACLSPAAFQFVAQQLQIPVDTPPFHVIAPSSYVTWPAMTGLPPITVDAICIDMTGGVVGAVSPVTRIVIH